MTMTTGSLLGCLLLSVSMPVVLVTNALVTNALAMNNVYQREQDVVGLRLGQRVMVDDGTCPQGQIKEMFGAKMTSAGVTVARKCLPRSGPKTR